MIEFKNVCMTYKTNGAVALDRVSVTIEDGEFVFIVGASGAGKSSFLSVIMGQEHIDSGIIRVGPYNLNGIKKRDLPYLRRMLGIVFQDFRLIPKMTVYDNVAFALRVIGMSESKIRNRVEYVLRLVDLHDKLKMFPHQLSTGERQRVAIARALVNNPSVIIADEPTGNLDPVLSNEIMDLFDRINAMGVTVIVVTHDLELVHQFDHRIVTLEKGKLVSDIPSSYQMQLQNSSSSKDANESYIAQRIVPDEEIAPTAVPVEEEYLVAEVDIEPDAVSVDADDGFSDIVLPADIEQEAEGDSNDGYSSISLPDYVPIKIDDTDYHDYLIDDADLDSEEGEGDSQ